MDILICGFISKYGPQIYFLLRFGLLPDQGDLLPRHQGEVRGALLPDPGDVLPRRKASLLRDILFRRRNPLLALFLGELLAGI